MTFLNPKFLTKNSISDVSELSDSATTSSSNRVKLIDRNNEFKYVSIGAASGTRTITWTPTVATTITRIIVSNCNWATFTIKYNTSNNFSTAISVTSGTKTDYYFEFNSVSVNNVVFSVSATITANETIRVGQIYCGSEIFEMGVSAGTLSARPVNYQKTIQLSDGTYQKIHHRRVVNWELRLQVVPKTERDKYRDLLIRNRLESFVFIPEPATMPDNWNGEWGHYIVSETADIDNYTDDIAENGYNVSIDFLQAGGIG